MTLENKGKATGIDDIIDESPVDIKIAYIGGGSRGWVHNLMSDLFTCSIFNGEILLYDIDMEMAELNAQYGNWLQSHPESKSNWKFRAVPILKEALIGADFIFLSIQPGSIELMQHDIEEPMKYGIYQPVGDTVGPGGCIRALRTIKDYRVFGEAIGEYSPDSWVINFTNPMTICVRTLYKTFPGIKAFGCCHEVFGTQRLLGKIYNELTGEPEPSRSEIAVNVLGINHFTWIDKANCKGNDLLEMTKEYIKRDGVIRKYSEAEIVDGENYFTGEKQVVFDLFKKYGVLAAAGDRHLAEFVYGYLTSENSCYEWGFRLTPYSYRISRYMDSPCKTREKLEKGKFPEIKRSGEEFINQMLALVGKKKFVTNINVPNRGQMGKTPIDAVVETNAQLSLDSVKPVDSGSLPDNVNDMVQVHIQNQENLVESVFTDNSELAFKAFSNDPLCSQLTASQAEDLYKTMLKMSNFLF